MKIPSQLPIWRTPEFWRELAKEWRGPETKETNRGICQQLIYTISNVASRWEAEDLVYQFRPPNCGLYFFPIGDRASRAALCDKIATHLENEIHQTQASSAQDEIQQ